MLGRGFHTLIKGVSFSSPTDVGSHNPPPFGTSVLACTRSFLQSMWAPPNPPPPGPNVLASTSPHVHPLSGLTLLAGTSPGVSGFDTICNSPRPPLADIVLFGLSFKVFKTCLLGRDFHTLLKGVSFTSPTNVGSHKKK